MTAVEQEQSVLPFLEMSSSSWEGEIDEDLRIFINQQEQLTQQSGSFGHADEMYIVIERIRRQLRHIVHSVRCWHERHERLTSPIRKRYSAYEGVLCYADLRRHWAYYRYAMREYKAMLSEGYCSSLV